MNQKQTQPIVRDLRRKEKFVVDDDYLNGYARFLGPYATVTYVSLCRRANFKTQTCFPAQELIAWENGISLSSVKRAMTSLIEYNIIQIQRERNDDGTLPRNIYYLLDKTQWKRAPEVSQAPGINTPPELSQTCDQGSHRPPKVTNSKVTNLNRRSPSAKPVPKSSNRSGSRANVLSDEEQEIDADSREIIDLPPEPNKPRGVAEGYQQLLLWAEKRKGKKFTNKGRQYLAMKMMRNAKITGTRMMEKWIEMENDTYWGARGFDWMNVMNEFNKETT